MWSIYDEEDFINSTYKNANDTCTTTQGRKKSTRTRMIPQRYQHAPNPVKRIRIEEWESKNQDNLETTEETDNFPDMVRQPSKETRDGDTTQRIQGEHSTLVMETSLPTKNSRLLLIEGGAHTEQSKRRGIQEGPSPKNEPITFENTLALTPDITVVHHQAEQKDNRRPTKQRKRRARQQLSSPEPKRRLTKITKPIELQTQQQEPDPITHLNTPFDRGKLHTRSRTNPSYKDRRGGHTANRY